MKRMIALVLSLVMALSLCAPAWGAGGAATEISTVDALKSALTQGGEYNLTADLHPTEPITVPSGVTVVLNMNGKTIAGTNSTTNTHNDMFLVKGTLTVNGGTITQTHDATNMEWNGCTNTFDITAGGVLNLNGVTVENLGGTDMNFAVHMNNWGEVTLNVQNSYLKATYMPVRVFNSGPDMNNVTIENSTLDGGNHSFWVHNYTSADFGGKLYSAAAAAYDEDAVAARLKFDIYGNGNTFITGKPYPVRYGFTGSTYFTSEGISSDVVAKVGNEYYKTLQEAVEAAVDGDTITLLDNIEFSSANCGFNDGTWRNGVKYTGDKSFTIDLDGKTISDNGDINDYLLNFINKGAKANEITLENGTIIGGANLWTVLSVGSSSATYPTTLNLGAGLTVTDNGAGSIGEVAVVKSRFGSVVNVLDGATVKTDTADFCVAGGTASNDTTAAANIYSGATITMNNAAGIAVSGTANVNIYGGTITSAGWGVHTMTSGTPVFTISGGTITGKAGAVASAADVNNYPDADPSVTISGGDINGAVSELVWGTPAGTAGGEVVVTGGYFTVDPSAYCADKLTGVASDKAGYLYMVGEKKAAAAEVDVAAPVVSADKVNTTNATVNSVVNTIGGTSGVEIDNAALTAAAVGAANENTVTPTVQQAEALNDLPAVSGATVNNVAIVVQTYFDVEITDVKVDETTNKAPSITVDITPMQQTVATTEDVIDSNADIKVGKNAVKVGEPAPVKITEPVAITLKLPSTCFAVGDKVYITHQASVGTVIYEATVADDYTITFTTTHGFSLFTLSVENTIAAKVGNDSYADLQSAIDNAGKNATITVVKAGKHKATVKGETSFTVEVLENDATVNISAAPGYKLSGPDANGLYTVTKVTGGYYPYNPAPTTKPVQSAKTFDAGIAMYIGMSVMAACGSAVVIGKKKD